MKKQQRFGGPKNKANQSQFQSPGRPGPSLRRWCCTSTAEQITGGYSNGKENTLDGDFSTRWSAEGEQSITFELADEYLVSYFKVAFHKGDIRTTTLRIDVSTDNSTFTNVVETGAISGFLTARE